MNKIRNFVKDWMLVIAFAVIIALVINKFIFFVISVPSGSMYPTIKPKDKIITTRIHNVNKIKKGDILVFYSDELQETMVKRVVGLPNDLVEIKEDGSVFINGQKTDEPYVIYPDSRTGKFKVPDGEYLFLGDNRSHSFDSRSWEDPFIQEEDIKGKALFVIFPFDRVSKLE
ncbi:MAG: signal peptidase [Clostridium butyricum]|uniref:Signal peptidase I n=1 Tax=Clostridium butyricum TaxID=1492 RepID=A0A512TTB5_CLOBU|nr:signal peptidase I [Clostridium butyricum]MDK2830082.1 signal peptidase [Clostridium butyricum]NOW22740.1 signal peptidase I [Clostridium butyricum]GEQ23178.1 S26 family signal peptidase [Clostridium butyricum]